MKDSVHGRGEDRSPRAARKRSRLQLTTPEQKASELLFPTDDGGFRSECFLTKAFAVVSGLVGLKKKFTLRRTFNDLMRIAKVEAIVTKSISGHLTDRMHQHYSTVTPDEQRVSIGNVVSLFGRRPKAPSGEGRGEGGSGGGRV